MSKEMKFDNHCMYCLRTKDKVKSLKPIYDWSNNNIIGWFCDEHYDQVEHHQIEQKKPLSPIRKTVINIFI